jgi:hypothetical protein
VIFNDFVSNHLATKSDSGMAITEDLRSAQINAANVILLPFRSLTLN